MIIALAMDGNHEKALVDPHFGRCSWFCVYDTENQSKLFLENTLQHQEQAGSEAAKFLINKKVEIVIAGRFGCKVAEVFRENNIQMVIPEIRQSLNEIMNKIK